MAKGLLELDESNFENEVVNSDVPVIVEFGATWCGPCRALEPILERLAQKWGAARKLATINVDDSPAIATKYGVRGTPTIIVFAQGKEIARQIGLTNEAKIAAIVDRAASAQT